MRSQRLLSRLYPPIVPLVWILVASIPARATIRYEVALSAPAEHTFHVAMTIPGVHGGVTIQMAAWDALYQIRDFAHRVSGMRALDDSGRPLPVLRTDKQTWRVTADGQVRIEYAAFWDESGPFGTQLDGEHAFLNLAMVLCYVPDRTAEDSILRFANVPAGWRIAVELPAADPADPGAFTYSAKNYDALADAPVEIGRFDEIRFTAGGRRIRAIVQGDSVDRSRLVSMLASIVNYQTHLMGDAPFEEYLFILHIGRRYGGGGMEHSNSTAIVADSAAALPNITAHEFFHLWNVKRIRPQSLEPLDRTREMWTRALWFAEGVTNTYAAYTLVRTGLWTRSQFLQDLSSQISELQSRPARQWQSAEESSLVTWFDKYDLYTSPELSISYYNKGQLLGFGLDLLIRDRTDNRASLDDVLRAMNQQYAHRGRFYRDSADIRSVAEQVIRQAKPGADADLSSFFARYVSGTDELPYAEWLAIAGLTLKVSAQHYQIEEVPQPSERQKQILSGLLSGEMISETQAAAAGR